MAIDENDWRLHGQEGYLKAKTWPWKVYRKLRDSWDHDHCCFCWETFTEPGTPNTSHEGYTTEDDYWWLCKTCFDDFKEMFQWRQT